MSIILQYFKVFVLATLLLLGLSRSQHTASSPLYGGERHHYDKSAVAPELPAREREVRLNNSSAECVRTAWIGDVNNRKLICVEYRQKKASR
jgi:hypothetical protein